MPEGLTLKDFRHVLEDVNRAGCPIVGADWTEYNPTLDTPNRLTGISVLSGLLSLLQSFPVRG